MHTTLPAGTVPAARGLTNPFLSPKRIAAHRRYGKGTGEMTSIQKTLEDVAKTMTKQVTTVLAEAGKKHGVTITDALLEDVLVGLGLVELKITVKKTKSVSSDGEKTRKRVVSKKMKEAYLALEGANEENLKEAMKAYKDEPEVESAIALEPLANSTEPLFHSLTPCCSQRGRCSYASCTRPRISLAVSPLLARRATVLSAWKIIYQRINPHVTVDLPA
jgi:hypothetical protein